MVWCVAVSFEVTGGAPATCSWWFMYTQGLVVDPAEFALGSGFSGWAVAPAGPLGGAGSGRCQVDWVASLGVGCSPLADLTFLRPVVVCGGGAL